MRIELTTLGLLDPRSNQLSYEGNAKLAQTTYHYIYFFYNFQHRNQNLFISIGLLLPPFIPCFKNTPGIHSTYFVPHWSQPAAWCAMHKIELGKLQLQVLKHIWCYAWWTWACQRQNQYYVCTQESKQISLILGFFYFHKKTMSLFYKPMADLFIIKTCWNIGISLHENENPSGGSATISP